MLSASIISPVEICQADSKRMGSDFPKAFIKTSLLAFWEQRLLMLDILFKSPVWETVEELINWQDMNLFAASRRLKTYSAIDRLTTCKGLYESLQVKALVSIFSVHTVTCRGEVLVCGCVCVCVGIILY